MNNHSFTFILSGIDASSDSFEDRFYEAGCDDATLALTHGLVAACFDREADNFTHAVISAYADVCKTGAIVERFEPDFLVSQAEIATRANLSRSAVSLYVSGERGADFPKPAARITTNSPLWDWVEVSAWLHQHGALPSIAVVNARVARTVNWFVQKTSADLRSGEKTIMEKMRRIACEPVLALA